MLTESLKTNDKERIELLKRALLEIEQKSVKSAVDKESTSSSPLAKPVSESSTNCSPLLFPEKMLQEPDHFTLEESQYLEKAIAQNAANFDRKVKIMIVGDQGTCKTSLMNTILGVQNPLNTVPTHGYSLPEIKFELGWILKPLT